MQYGQQQVLFVYLIGSLYACLQYSQSQYVAGLLVQHQVGSVYGLTDFVLPYAHFQFSLYRLHIQVQPVKQVDNRTLVTAQNAKQQVFGTHRSASQSSCLFTRESQYF